MKVEIKYKDKTNWETVELGTVTDWDNYSRKLKDGRVLPYYLPNEFTTDTWNGKEFSIQDKLWETYYFEFDVQEFENLELNRINSCSEIEIIQYNTRNGSVISKSYLLDTTKSDYFQISQPERLGNTSSAKTSIIFRTRRTIINKGEAVLNTNTLVINSVLYYSDFDLLKWSKETDDINVDWGDGTERRFQTINKTGFQFLLYLNNSDWELFEENIKASTTTTINATQVTEIEYEVSEIGENYNKIIVKGVTNTTVNNFNVSPLNTYNLKVVDNVPDTYDFYTDVSPVLKSEAPIKSSFTNGGAINSNARSITKEVKQLTFYLDETSAFELKKRFELGGTITLDSVPVKESREVVPELIGVKIYKVVVDCLIDTSKTYKL